VRDVLAVLKIHGLLLPSAKGPVPNVADLVADERISGSWWGHPRGREIYAALEKLCESSDVVRTRVVDGKITYVHRRLWPALVRASAWLDPDRLASIEEIHTPTGHHQKLQTPFPRWVPKDVAAAAALLTDEEARKALPECLRR
jgi:hypothetical protein